MSPRPNPCGLPPVAGPGRLADPQRPRCPHAAAERALPQCGHQGLGRGRAAGPGHLPALQWAPCPLHRYPGGTRGGSSGSGAAPPPATSHSPCLCAEMPVALAGQLVSPPVSSGAGGHAWLSLDEHCHLHYEISVAGLGRPADGTVSAHLHGVAELGEMGARPHQHKRLLKGFYSTEVRRAPSGGTPQQRPGQPSCPPPGSPLTPAGSGGGEGPGRRPAAAPGPGHCFPASQHQSPPPWRDARTGRSPPGQGPLTHPQHCPGSPAG